MLLICPNQDFVKLIGPLPLVYYGKTAAERKRLSRQKQRETEMDYIFQRQGVYCSVILSSVTVHVTWMSNAYYNNTVLWNVLNEMDF